MNESLQQAARLIETERAQIASEVHDGLLPLLFAASATLSNLMDQATVSGSPQAQRQLQQARDWIDQARQTGRNLLAAIYPPELQQMSWSRAAVDVTGRLFGDAAQQVHWQLDPLVDQLPEAIALAAYRIVVEAVRNALRHAKASEVQVIAERLENQLRITIFDNGKGFDPHQVAADRYGLRSMKGRAQFVGGELLITSAPGGPTSICFTLNLPTLHSPPLTP